MKKILMALAVVAFAYTGAEAQTKTAKAQEKCSLSADGKFVTCCKTMPNPAYNIKGKTADAQCPPVAKTTRKKAAVRSAVKLPPRAPRKTYYVKDYQVCKDEGGYYTCCLYQNTYQHTEGEE